jgi:hypothetical protein
MSSDSIEVKLELADMKSVCTLHSPTSPDVVLWSLILKLYYSNLAHKQSLIEGVNGIYL